MRKFKVCLSAEDGDYCLRDNFDSWESAERYADSVSSNYGEGQQVYISEYAIQL